MMWQSAEIRRVALGVLLANVLLVGGAALLRHAAADDPRALTAVVPDRPAAADAQAGDVAAPTGIDKSLAAPSSPARGGGPDPVLDELRKLIRDPASGLDLSPIQVPEPAASSSPAAKQPKRWAQLRQRVESVHHISCAAYQLHLEAIALADAGQTAEADAIMQRVVELHAILAKLASPPENKARTSLLGP